MNTSFEILKPQTQVTQNHKKWANPSFTVSTGRRMSFVSASWSVDMSMVVEDCRVMHDRYQPVFVEMGSFQNELILALSNDYEIQTKLLRKLETLKETLSENWNGEDDCPMEEGAYNNTKVAIKSTPSVMLKYWRLFPNPNGTLLFSPKNNSIAGISIGNDEFSYAAFVSDDKQISGREPFSEQAFKCALGQIHRILGYV